MILEISCDESLSVIISSTKNILNLIKIIVPILLIVFASISLIKLLKNPEEKNGTKKIINQFIAAVIVFFIPLFVDVVMNLAGDNNQLSSCWINTSAQNFINTTYRSSLDKERKKITYDATDYEPGIPNQLDFSCTSNIVKANFSCETLKIVEKHLYELKANNFYNVINSHGGFANYAKSVGGVFGDYYGQEMPHETAADFQRAAEYVIGWMYMYGWTYWGSPNVFWKNGFYDNYDKSKVEYYNDGHKKAYEHFDMLVSGERGINKMATACGELEIFAYDKMGLARKRKNQLPKVARLRDLKVGDAILFFNGKVNDKLNESTWNFGNVRHNVIVGEVYSDHLVIYDVGSYFPKHQNYKRVIYFPNEASGETDMDAIRKEYTYYGKNVDWGMRRWYDFKDS